jgi:chromatin remodeling complex protein RSC6
MPRDNSKPSKFMAPVQPDAALAAIVGAEPISRPEITKRIWNHIKQYDLQDATNRRAINCDGALQAIADGRAQITMFDIGQCVKAHTSAVSPAAAAAEG